MVDIIECCVFFFLFVLAAAFVKEIAFFVQTEIKSHLGGRADEGWGMGGELARINTVPELFFCN